MLFKRLVLGLAALFLFSLGTVAHAQPANISQKVGVCDPKFGNNCEKPNADGSLNVNITGGGTLTNYALETGGNLAASKADLDALVAAAANPAGILGTNGSTIASPTNGLDVVVRGAAASGASVSGNPLLTGCRAATAAPTAVTDGQAVAMECGVEGRVVTAPYAIKEVQVRGSTSGTDNAQHSIIASAGGSLRNYITAIQCANSGSTTSILTFTDDATTILINPSGGGGSWTFPVPLRTAAATAFQVTFGSSSTTQYCSAQGFTGL